MPRSLDQASHPATARAATDEAASQWLVRVVHAAVKGRARLEVNGLYRCEPIRVRIESTLSRRAGIKQVSANILTGKLLIIFDPVQHIEEIKGLVEQVLSRPVPADAAQDSAAVNGHPSRSLSPAATHGFSPTSQQEQNNWHILAADEVLADLETSGEHGLSRASVQWRLQRFGANSLPQTPPRSSLSIFLGQFKGVPVLLLGASALLSAVTERSDAAVILGVILINAGTGYVTESGAGADHQYARSTSRSRKRLWSAMGG